MSTKIRNVIVSFCVIIICCLIPVFFMRGGMIEVDFPVLDSKLLTETAEQTQKAAQRTAAQRRHRKLVSCQSDEDCVIVDKDPCGCLVGPQGVTAINASYTLEFNKMQEGVMAKACPEGEPSQEKECSPSAQAVCQAHVCRIQY